MFCSVFGSRPRNYDRIQSCRLDSIILAPINILGFIVPLKDSKKTKTSSNSFILGLREVVDLVDLDDDSDDSREVIYVGNSNDSTNSGVDEALSPLDATPSIWINCGYSIENMGNKCLEGAISNLPHMGHKEFDFFFEENASEKNIDYLS